MQVFSEVQEIVEAVRSLTDNEVILQSRTETDGYLSSGRLRNDGTFIITYNHEHADELDYIVAYQCSRLLRLLLAQPEDRKIPRISREENDRAFNDLVRDFARLNQGNIPYCMLTDEFDTTFPSLMYQLFSAPVDARIEKWISASFKTIAKIQQESMNRHFIQDFASRNTQDEGRMLTRIYKASHAMNYAYARFLHHYMCFDEVLAFYNGSDHESLGNRLLEYLPEKDTGHRSDIRAIDKWADIMGMSGWYHWQDYDALAQFEKNKRNKQHNGRNML